MQHMQQKKRMVQEELIHEENEAAAACEVEELCAVLQKLKWWLHWLQGFQTNGGGVQIVFLPWRGSNL